MKKSPLVSIIVPVYLTASTVRQTLDSIKNQTYTFYEIIIINDGSPDNAQEVLYTYSQENSNLSITIYEQENKGESAARNKGIELSSGDFICFLDSDDTYAPTFLEEMIQRQKETGGDVIYCGMTYTNKEGVVTEIPYSFKEGYILKEYLTSMFSFCCTLIRKKFITEHNILFPVGMPLAEDLIFLSQVLIKAHVYCVPKYLFNYIYRYDSVTNQIVEKNLLYEDILGRTLLLDIVQTKYVQEDYEEAVELCELFLLEREIHYVRYSLSNFEYKKVFEYIKNTTFLQRCKKNKSQLSKNKRRMLMYLKDKKSYKVMLGCFYYSIIRNIMKKIKKIRHYFS